MAQVPLALLQAPGGLDGWADTLADVATIVIAVAMIAIALALIFAALQVRKIFGKVHALLDRAYDDARPIVGHVHDVANNVNYISASIRADVEELKHTLTATQASLTEAARGMERRINEFNALLGVVQQEAEQIFIDTASTIRGVKTGARTLRRQPSERWIEEIDALPSARSRRSRAEDPSGY